MNRIPQTAPLPEERCFTNACGVCVRLFPNPALHSFCLSLYVRAGSMFESERDNGITHLLEHLVFRSINRSMNGTLYSELDRLGLCFEGCTYKEFVRFTVSGAKEHFAEGSALLLKVLAPLTLTAEDIRTEKGRVKAEIREDGERTSLDYFTDRILYGETTLANTITGKASALDSMGITRLAAYHKVLFSANNIFFYATGAIEEQNMLAFLALSDRYPLDRETPTRENIAPVPADFGKRGGKVFLKNDPKRHIVRLSIDVDTKGVKDAELTLLYDLLFGEGESCRLHRALSEETGYIYSFRASLELYRNIGTIAVSYEIPPSLFVPSVTLMLKTVCEVKRGIGDALAYVKAPYTDNAYLMYDSDSDFNWNRAYESGILGLPYKTIEERAAAYAAVTPEAICALAKRLFVPDNMLLTLKGNKKTVDLHALEGLMRLSFE